MPKSQTQELSVWSGIQQLRRSLWRPHLRTSFYPVRPWDIQKVLRDHGSGWNQVETKSVARVSTAQLQTMMWTTSLEGVQGSSNRGHAVTQARQAGLGRWWMVARTWQSTKLKRTWWGYDANWWTQLLKKYETGYYSRLIVAMWENSSVLPDLNFFQEKPKIWISYEASQFLNARN